MFLSIGAFVMDTKSDSDSEICNLSRKLPTEATCEKKYKGKDRE